MLPTIIFKLCLFVQKCHITFVSLGITPCVCTVKDCELIAATPLALTNQYASTDNTGELNITHLQIVFHRKLLILVQSCG